MAKGKVGSAVGTTVQHTVENVGTTVASLGEYLREQRLDSRLSLRQLAELTGVSNPYLSQIERGLRRPSAQVLQQLSRALRVSADQLYVRAGIVGLDDLGGSTVETAVLHDALLTERQKQSLLDVYSSFLALNETNGRDERATPTSTTESQRRAGPTDKE